MKASLQFSLSIVLILAAYSQCFASITSFSNRGNFVNELASFQNVDFEGDYNSSWNGYNTAAGYVDATGMNFVGNVDPFSSYYLYITESDQNSYGSNFGSMPTDVMLGEGRGDITMTLPGSENSIGLDFVATETTIGAPVEFTFVVNGTEILTAVNSAGSPSFFGIISTDEISTFEIRTTATTRPPQFLIDNVTFGNSSFNAAVPEPTTAMIFAGLGLTFLRRRRS